MKGGKAAEEEEEERTHGVDGADTGELYIGKSITATGLSGGVEEKLAIFPEFGADRG
jgi:hypothetical protein